MTVCVFVVVINRYKPFCICVICSRTKIDEIQQRKEEELKSINLRVQKLQSDLMNANQVRIAYHDLTFIIIIKLHQILPVSFSI